jgi:hypothetical protein
MKDVLGRALEVGDTVVVAELGLADKPRQVPYTVALLDEYGNVCLRYGVNNRLYNFKVSELEGTLAVVNGGEHG